MPTRLTAVAVYSYIDDTNVVEIIPNNGEHWKEVVRQHSEFTKFDDDLAWVSDDPVVAEKQFLANDLIVVRTTYDLPRPLVQNKKVA